MKKVILLGANGHTGGEITPRLLEQDDVELTLFARNAKHLDGFKGARVHAVEGDAHNRDDPKKAVQGQDIGSARWSSTRTATSTKTSASASLTPTAIGPLPIADSSLLDLHFREPT